MTNKQEQEASDGQTSTMPTPGKAGPESGSGAPASSDGSDPQQQEQDGASPQTPNQSQPQAPDRKAGKQDRPDGAPKPQQQR